MENQHRKIKGYRELSQPEIDLMNEVKQKGIELNELINRLGDHIHKQIRYANSLPTNDEKDRLNLAEPLKWLREGQTHLQSGLMELTRSVAQPGFF